MQLKNITGSLSTVFRVLPHFLNSFLILFIYYQINSKITKLSAATINISNNIVDNISAVVDQSLNKLTAIFTRDIIEKGTQIENHLIKIDKLADKLSHKHDVFIQETSSKTNHLVLKLIEGQSNLANSMGHQNSLVCVVPQSNTKTYIVSFVLLCTIGAAIGFYFIPKVITLSTTQFIKIKYIAAEVLRLMPGSNSASGVTHLPDHPNIKISTNIEDGISIHTFVDLSTNKEGCLLEFVDSLIKQVANKGIEGASNIDAGASAGTTDLITNSVGKAIEFTLM